MDALQDSTPDLVPLPVVLAAQQATTATTFLSLPRELRDLIYSYLFEAEYTQIRVNAYLRNLRLDQVDGGKFKPSHRLAIMGASRRLWEEGSRIFYGENVFRLHVGTANFDTMLLTQRTVDLMQDVEISLYPKKVRESVRVLQLFGTSQIVRKSCTILLRFRQASLMNNETIEALKCLTGFKILTFEVDVPAVISKRFAGIPELGAPIPWVSSLLASIKNSLTPALGNSIFANSRRHRRLIFKPQDHKG